VFVYKVTSLQYPLPRLSSRGQDWRD